MTNWAKYNHLRVTLCFAALVVWSSGLEPASESSANKWPWFDTCWSLWGRACCDGHWARACSDVHVQQTFIKKILWFASLKYFVLKMVVVVGMEVLTHN